MTLAFWKLPTSGIEPRYLARQPSGPAGYFQIRKSGGLDLTSNLEAKFGARPGQVHQISGKTWEVMSPQDAKLGKNSQFWGHI